MRIIVATHNEGKLVEINRILEDCLGVDADQVELVSAGSLNLPDPVEDGVTFQENALLVPDDQPARAVEAGEKLTSAQMEPAEKNAISHRGKALRALLPSVATLLK